jgi:hypothetical protein
MALDREELRRRKRDWARNKRGTPRERYRPGKPCTQKMSREEINEYQRQRYEIRKGAKPPEERKPRKPTRREYQRQTPEERRQKRRQQYRLLNGVTEFKPRLGMTPEEYRQHRRNLDRVRKNVRNPLIQDGFNPTLAKVDRWKRQAKEAKALAESDIGIDDDEEIRIPKEDPLLAALRKSHG